MGGKLAQITEFHFFKHFTGMPHQYCINVVMFRIRKDGIVGAISMKYVSECKVVHNYGH